MTGLDKVISVLKHYTEEDGDPFDIACDEAYGAQLGAELVSQENQDLRRLLAMRTIPAHELDTNSMIGLGVDFMCDTPADIGEKLYSVDAHRIKAHLKGQACKVLGKLKPVKILSPEGV